MPDLSTFAIIGVSFAFGVFFYWVVAPKSKSKTLQTTVDAQKKVIEDYARKIESERATSDGLRSEITDMGADYDEQILNLKSDMAASNKQSEEISAKLDEAYKEVDVLEAKLDGAVAPTEGASIQRGQAARYLTFRKIATDKEWEKFRNAIREGLKHVPKDKSKKATSGIFKGWTNVPTVPSAKKKGK